LCSLVASGHGSSKYVYICYAATYAVFGLQMSNSAMPARCSCVMPARCPKIKLCRQEADDVDEDADDVDLFCIAA